MIPKQDSIIHKFKVFRVLMFAASFLMTIILLILFLGKMEETVFAEGVVRGLDDYELRTQVNSRIKAICKDLGESVKKGDIIIELDSRKLTDEIEIHKNLTDELEAELSVKRKSLIVLRNDPLPRYYKHSEIALEERLKQFDKSKEKLEIYKGLRNKKVVSKVEFDRIEKEYFTEKAELEKAREDHETVMDGLGEKILKSAESEIKLLEVKLQNKKKQLSLLEDHLSDYIIKANDNGVVTFMPYRKGRYVEEGEVIAKMSTVKQKKLVVYVDERQIFKVKTGQEARISSRSYDKFTFGYFPGRVIQIAELPEKRDNNFCYPVEILITEEPYNLKLGSTAETLIVTGSERIITALLGLDR
ncbi:MAG: hypothetical protein A2020_06980 [Lentisphaerae bacterium GWF2_45_14]|nr:MAG: hypothetical protein A2020_06980 [Lentisphaerae bacterium GWF2_45_14]